MASSPSPGRPGRIFRADTSLGRRTREASQGVHSSRAGAIVHDSDALEGRFRIGSRLPTATNLCELLVRNGLARIYGTRTPLPEGRTSSQYLAHLRELEAQAKAEGLGGGKGESPQTGLPVHRAFCHPPCMTLIEVRPYRSGWQVYEMPGVAPFYIGPDAFDHALGYAKSRLRYGSGEIRVLNAAGEVTQTILSDEKVGRT